MRTVWRFFSLIEVCVMFLLVLCLVMAAGSFLLKGDYAAAINAMPLMEWLRIVPVATSWWLWSVVVVLFFLVVNTVVCSTDVIATRWGRGNAVSLLAPQLIHAGFILIAFAHLLSATGSYFEQIRVVEGSVFQLPTGQRIGIVSLSSLTTPRGMPIGFSADLVDLQNVSLRTPISPNHPWFTSGYGVYLKQVDIHPYREGLLEIHREPGCGAALAGAILFTVGNVLVVWFRSRARDAGHNDP